MYDSSNREAVITTLAKQSFGHISHRHAQILIDEILPDNDHVYIWGAGKGTLGVAYIIDNCDNVDSSAELGIASDRLTPQAFAEILAWAAPILAKSGKDNVDSPNWNSSGPLAPLLTSHGFTRAFSMYSMRRHGERVPGNIHLHSSYKWIPLTPKWVEPYYRTLKAAMLTVPGAFVPALDNFSIRALQFAIPPQLLIEGEVVRAYYRVEKTTEQSGEIGILGRHPDCRGGGLGVAIMHHAINHLVELGCAEQTLEVAATNQNALKLYVNHGFQITRNLDVYRRRIGR